MPKKYPQPENNYRMVIAYKGHINDGSGWCRNIQEARQNFDSVIKKNIRWIWCELYFENKLIKRNEQNEKNKCLNSSKRI